MKSKTKIIIIIIMGCSTFGYFLRDITIERKTNELRKTINSQSLQILRLEDDFKKALVRYNSNRKKYESAKDCCENKKDSKKEDLWGIYTNKKLGFSIKYPKSTAVMSRVNCGDGSALTEKRIELVPLQYNREIYFAAKYYEDERCQKVLNTGMLEHEKEHNKIEFLRVNNEKEAEKEIQQRWGKDCIITKKEKAAQSGVYILQFGDKNTGGFNPSIENGCQSNGRVETRYVPSKNIMMIWSIGQDCSISYDLFGCANNEMLSSLKFL
jgi:hypothetical protein